MCGIAGIYHAVTMKPVDPMRVERMCDAMVHRGPDGAGVWTAPGIGLGHRRLSIIDIAGSPQPMLSADESVVLSFNGEIYNYRELRRELEQGGATFRTDGDSEVIIAAWQKWGAGCLARLDGMFAFAIWDQRAKSLFLARDRLGVKPLHYAELSDGSLIFASELKGLLAHPLMRRRVDVLAVDDYLAWGYVPDNRSIIAGVRKLPAGHFVLWQQGKQPAEPTQWWDIDFSKRHAGSEADLSAELIHLLRDAVRSRMVADVPLGAFLSGGVDSSSVVALMSEASNQPVKTCSIGFDVAAADETSYAAAIAAKFGTDHSSRVVGQGDFALVDDIAAMFDEPFADASALPTWRVCQLARETVTVALSGDGADEAFAGYRRQVFHHHEERVRRFIPESLRAGVLGPLSNAWPKADWAPRPLRAKTTLQSLSESGPAGYARALSIMNPAQRDALYSDAMRSALGGYRGEEHLIALMEGASGRSGLDQAQYADLKFWLPGDILTKTDRTSMAVSLEAREPLLDHRLIEFAAALPDRMRVRGQQGKFLLKKSMERYLPDDILYRPKQGFVTPISSWFRGPLANSARALANNEILGDLGWFDAARIDRLAHDHIVGKSDNSRTLWQLLMLEKSLRHLQISG